MITVVTAWYNEAFLADLFLSHYSFADKIIILLDELNNDNSLEIIKKYSNIEVKKLLMPDGMDDALKQLQINQTYINLADKPGWVIIADADEFIYFPQNGMKNYLAQSIHDVIKVDYYQIYQHKFEKPLNHITPVFEQRRCGKKVVNLNASWEKPCIARTGLSLNWTPGHHDVVTIVKRSTPITISDKKLLGAHWAMADIDLAIERRIAGRKNRMSKNNLARGFSNHNFKITKEQIIKECEQNSSCPQIF